MTEPKMMDPESSSSPRPKRMAQLHRWPWGLILLCWLAWGFFYASRLRLEVPGIDWPKAFLFALPDALLWTILTPIPVILARRFPVGRDVSLVHGVIHLVAAVAVALTQNLLDASLNWLQLRFVDSSGPGGDAFIELFLHLVYYGFHSNVFLYAVIVGISHYLTRVENLREERRRASELRAQLSEARLETLRLQLRPHFLFNVLNTISGLMTSDPQTGQRVVRQLGELLRMSLSSKGAREIPLRRELELARAFLEIEGLRFHDRLTTSIDADEDVLDCNVPPLILQPILENAVRHGMPAEGSGGRVEVSVTGQDSKLELRVVDNGPGLGGEIEEGIGIANTKARLAELYGDRQSFRMEPGSDGGLVVVMALPRRSDLGVAG